MLAFAGDSDLVFVGRSPQPLFDLLLDTSWADRLRLFNVSLREVESPNQAQLLAIFPYLYEVGLEPHAWPVEHGRLRSLPREPAMIERWFSLVLEVKR